jgi:hypothetical protein
MFGGDQVLALPNMKHLQTKLRVMFKTEISRCTGNQKSRIFLEAWCIKLLNQPNLDLPLIGALQLEI